MSTQQNIIDKLKKWANRRPDVRALVLTSSHTNPNATVDEFSDFDVIAAVEDIGPYLEDESWLEDFGRVLVIYRDPVQTEYGFQKFIRVAQYGDGLKIDFNIWPVDLLKRISVEPELPDYLDDGYRVLLDKDGLTTGMKTPSFRGFVTRVPTEAEYNEFVEGFFSNAPYVAKHIRRGDYFPLKSMLYYIRYEKLRRMLEWKAQIENNWSLRIGISGKGLVKYIEPEIIKELENTDTGAEDYWESLFRVIELFRKTTRKVGERLGYSYPEDLDGRVMAYLQKVKGQQLP